MNGGKLCIEPLGDTHVGSIAFAREKFIDRVDVIRREKDRYWIGMGDYVDNIRPYKRGFLDKRWELSLLRGEADWLSQWDEFVELVKPIRHKCLGMLWGNHEWSSYEEAEFQKMVERDLGVDFLGARAYILLQIEGKDVKKRDWTILAVHGDFIGDTKGGAVNRIKQISQNIVANIYLYAHTHFKSADKGERIFLEKDGKTLKLQREPVISVLTGGFIDPYYVGSDTYFDKKPRGKDIRVGTVTVILDPIEVKLYAAE
jgi:hypothetical protein